MSTRAFADVARSAMIPVVESPSRTARSGGLALGACLGGNLTLIAAAADVAATAWPDAPADQSGS